MRAMILPALCRLDGNSNLLHLVVLPDPVPGPGDTPVRVAVCGVCHTELDEIEGRTPPPQLPVILEHQVVGQVADLGPGASAYCIGERVGVGWIYSACGICEFCRSGRENLCPSFRATGRDAPGGYAELMVVPERFAYRIPDIFTDAEAAPLLCARGHRLSVAAIERLAGRAEPGPDRLRRIGAPGAEDGPAPLSAQPCLPFSAGRRPSRPLRWSWVPRGLAT